MTVLIHPAKKDFKLEHILSALSDPIRLKIVQELYCASYASCKETAPCPHIPKSTLSNHFRVLREAGLIRTSKKGVSHHNTLRLIELESRFPKLLETILKYSYMEA